MDQQKLTAFTDAGESNLSEQEECPTCGRGFDSEMGVKVHHVNAHGESIATVETDCGNCGKSIGRSRKHIENRAAVYCSDNCMRVGEKTDPAELLDQVHECYRRYGEVRGQLILSDPDFASLWTFRDHFGTLATAEMEAGVEEYDRCPECALAYDSLGSHWSLSDCSPPELTQRQREILTGVVMGDGHVAVSDTAPYVVLTGVRREFIEWFSDEMGVFSRGVREGSTGDELLERALAHGGGFATEDSEFRDQYTAHTCVSEVFQPWREWYGKDGKRFPTELDFTPLVAKVWYVCDGGLQTNGPGKPVVPVISSKNEEDRPEVLESLFEPVGFDATMNAKSLRIPVAQAKDFLDWLGDPVPGYRYKFAQSYDEYDRLKPF